MKMRTDKQQVGYELLNVFLAYENIDKRTRKYGTDTPIYPSEIHLISAIADIPGIHISGLSDKLSVTKGSISEMIRKLEKKDLVEKRTSQDNLSKLALYVTDKGQVAHEHHQKYHQIIDSKISAILKDANHENIEFILNFFKSLQISLKTFETDLIKLK